MVQTSSTMLPLGTQAPAFSLPDTNGRLVSLRDFGASRGLLVAFISNHCPFVKHIRAGLADFARDYTARGLGIVAIGSNDAAAFPEDGPDAMKAEVGAAGYVFPYLHDERQTIARAYRAACTPDFFLFDSGQRLVYRGQFDGSRPGNDVPVTGRDLRGAADAVLEGREVPAEQAPSLGCNIKWKPGKEPDYFQAPSSKGASL